MEEDRFSDLAAQCAESSTEALEAVQKLLTNLKQTKDDKDGLSLLKVKNYEMVAYLSELSVLMSKMMKGESIQNESATKRAIKHRVILEKMRPIEDKMKPQIEKLLSRKNDDKISATNGNLRVRLENMDVDDDDENEVEDEEDDEEGAGLKKEPKKYVAPKIRAVRYEDEEEEPNKLAEKAKRRAMQSSLIMELKNQFSDAPEEIREISEKKYQYDREREKYEEDNFTRVRMTKEQKRRSDKLGKAETLDDLLSFGDYMARGEDGRGMKEGLKRKRSSNGGSEPSKKRKMTQKERKKNQKGKKEGRKRAIRRRQ